MQLIAQILELIPAEIAGWMAVVAGFAALALLLRWLDPSRTTVTPTVIAALAPPMQRFEPGAEFEMTAGKSLAELRVRPDLLSIQKQAWILIDATDHAVNRLRADLAQVTGLISSPTFAPARQLVREPAAVPAQRQPLAA